MGNFRATAIDISSGDGRLGTVPKKHPVGDCPHDCCRNSGDSPQLDQAWGQSPSSVLWLARIDLVDPGDHAALEVLRRLEAMVAQERGRACAANSRLALADDLAVGVELRE